MAAEARTLHSLASAPTPWPLAPPRVTSGEEHAAPRAGPGRPESSVRGAAAAAPGRPRGRQRGAEVG